MHWNKLYQQLGKYHTLKMIFPEYTYYPDEIIKGFNAFCQQYAFHLRLFTSIEDEPINEGEVFINLMENDLVVLIERIIESNLRSRKRCWCDFLQRNTHLKKIILNGITTISTDFEAMGGETAGLFRVTN